MSSTGRKTHGLIAQRFASGFAVSDPVVVFDHTGVAEAFQDCMTRAFRGESFFVRAVLQSESSARVDSVAGSILSTFATLDERRIALEQACSGLLQANGRTLNTIPAYNPGSVRLMQAMLRLADGLVVSSQAERRRIEGLLETQPPAIIAEITDSSVPLRASRDDEGDRDAVVIWAPHLSGDVAWEFAAGIADLHLPLLLVSASEPGQPVPALWIPLQQSPEALKRAKLILDTSAFGCDAARGLASWGVPLVADVESGTQEVFEHVRTFDRRRMASLFEAVVSALGAYAPRDRKPKLEPALQIQAQPLLRDGPLASIVIPTLDRPVLLRYALESCRRQTYHNVETIVVVDGGPRLDALAEDFPEVRFLHMPENNPVVSTNTAFAQARGQYITLLSDDDLLFPEHVAALVTALENSGAAVAHADVLTAFLTGDDGDWRAYGFESNMSRSLDRSSLLVANRIGATSAMIRRSCLSATPFDASIPLYRDYALWLDLSSRYDFVHVERITSCYTIRNQGAGQQSTMWHDQATAAYEAIYARYPARGRPLIEQQRIHMLQSVRAGGTALASEPGIRTSPVSWPPV